MSLLFCVFLFSLGKSRSFLLVLFAEEVWDGSMFSALPLLCCCFVLYVEFLFAFFL